MTRLILAAAVAAAALVPLAAAAQVSPSVPLTYGDRPFYLVDKMQDGALKEKLLSCSAQQPKQSTFSIAHRGAPLMYPEHTVESNMAAARQGAGVFECDVTFTKDKELVCRHAQNDLHTTTNILLTPLAATCNKPFAPAAEGGKASAECRTSEITLAEFRTLTPKMDSSDATATTPEAFQGGVAPFRSTGFTDSPHLMTHAESIALFKSLGGKFTPELKDPSVEMPFEGFTLEQYAQKMLDEYEAAGVPAADVFPQSFNYDVITYWVQNGGEYGRQAVYLVEVKDGQVWDGNDPSTWERSPEEIKAAGVNFLAPALFMMLTLDEAGKIVPSEYAKAAKAAGLELIGWSLERSGPLGKGGGWYFTGLTEAIKSDSDYLTVVDVLAQQVGVRGIFSDWPATVTYYANCHGL